MVLFGILFDDAEPRDAGTTWTMRMAYWANVSESFGAGSPGSSRLSNGWS